MQKLPSTGASLRPASNAGEAPPVGSALRCSARSPTAGTDLSVVGDFDLLLLLGLAQLQPRIVLVDVCELLVESFALPLER